MSSSDTESDWDPGTEKVFTSTTTTTPIIPFVGEALLYHSFFEKRKPPWEMDIWNLDDFTIDGMSS